MKFKDDNSDLVLMAIIIIALVSVLIMTGCKSGQYGRVIQSQKLPPSPLMASASRQLSVVSSNSKAADTQAQSSSSSSSMPPKLVTFAFDDFSNDPAETVYPVVSTSDLTQPMTNWPVVMVLDGTSRSFTVPMIQRQAYFQLYASNTLTGDISDFATK